MLPYGRFIKSLLSGAFRNSFKKAPIAAIEVDEIGKCINEWIENYYNTIGLNISILII
jgi:hypothetical protein